MGCVDICKSSGHFTKCCGGQVHQVLYLCSEESGELPELSLVVPDMLKAYLGKTEIESYSSKLKQKNYTEISGHPFLKIDCKNGTPDPPQIPNLDCSEFLVESL